MIYIHCCNTFLNVFTTVSVWQVPTLNLIKNTKDWNYEKNLEQNTESICYTQC
jgi:hypothetical protein